MGFWRAILVDTLFFDDPPEEHIYGMAVFRPSASPWTVAPRFTETAIVHPY